MDADHQQDDRRVGDGVFGTRCGSGGAHRISRCRTLLPAPEENFTIAFDQGEASCTMRMDWETTGVGECGEEVVDFFQTLARHGDNMRLARGTQQR